MFYEHLLVSTLADYTAYWLRFPRRTDITCQLLEALLWRPNKVGLPWRRKHRGQGWNKWNVSDYLLEMFYKWPFMMPLEGGRLMMTGGLIFNLETRKYSLFLISLWMNWTFQIKVLLLSPPSNIGKNDGSGWGCEPCGSRIGLSGSVLICYKICLLSSVK